MSKLVKQKAHPELNLTLHCYTKRAFYKKAWNDDTINARGHVYDDGGNLVSCPFPKFFNLDEHETTAHDRVTSLMVAHRKEAKVYKKYNGHLSILFCHADEGEKWINTTKGSFDHEFIAPDRKLIEKAGFTEEVLHAHIPSNWTLMFEIVGDHDPHLMTDSHKAELGGETAVLLAIYDNWTASTVDGWEEQIWEIFDSMGYDEEDLPPMAEFVLLDDLVPNLGHIDAEVLLDHWKHLVTDTEGFILHIPSIDYRVKIKTDWFIQNRYKRQFNHEKTKSIFLKHFDGEQAFIKIPEELHEAYSDVLGDYHLFEAKYKQNMMESAFNVLEVFHTKHDMVNYILGTDQIESKLEKEAMVAYLTNQPGYEEMIREVFGEKYEEFSLVERDQLKEVASC